MQARAHAGENRAPFRARLIANRNDVRELFARPREINHRFGLIPGNVNAGFLHCLHRNRVQPSRLQSGAMPFKFIPADSIQERLSHLAAGAVMDANE
jgi:hypothetical protein